MPEAMPVATKKLGLALGSGSARGLAHIGVLRALREVGIEVDVVAGTSIGALVGAVDAAGKLDMLAATFQRFDWRRMASYFDVVLPRSGLLDGAKIGALVRAHVPPENISALSKPFAAVATDLASGEEVVIRSGDVIEAVRASISVPGIFTPVRWNGRILVDGGLVNPVPITAARSLGADVVIAVDLNHEIVAAKNLKPLLARDRSEEASGFSPWAQTIAQSVRELTVHLRQRAMAAAAPVASSPAPTEPMPNIFEVLLAAINIMESRITESRLMLDRPDLLIRPPLGHIRFLDFDRAEEIIEIGYRSAIAQLAAFARVRPPSL
ncbi:MAG: patatin-like phospholipase family protein [Alphaproteobacteria bacterium]|nr:patatin-like phospholipase family protein [Alphaproteobacteria bacterium]